MLVGNDVGDSVIDTGGYDGVLEGSKVGESVDGRYVGVTDGENVGVSEGGTEGKNVDGRTDGAYVGLTEGEKVGVRVGETLGAVGEKVGYFVGCGRVGK